MKKIYSLLLLLLPIIINAQTTENSQTLELYQKSFIIETQGEFNSLDMQITTFDYLYTLELDTIKSRVTVFRDNVKNGEKDKLYFTITDRKSDYFNKTNQLYEENIQTKGFLVVSGEDLVILGLLDSEKEKYFGFMGYIKN